jgi:hypothetical protein
MMRKVCGTCEERHHVPLQIQMQRRTLEALRLEARRRGGRADELAAAILRNVVSDDLYAAVIDR